MTREITIVQIVGMFVVGALMILCYGIMPAIGGAVLVALDRATFGMRWLGIGSPVAAWGLVGALFGGIAGAMAGLRRAGAPRHAPRLLLGAVGALAALFVFGLIYSATMRPARVSARPQGANRTQVLNVYTYTYRDP